MSSAPVYDAGHTPSVLSSHSWRTLSNSAAYLLPHLRPGMKVLDVGCGPGSMTIDLAKHVGPEGSVIGIDSAGPLPAARELAEQEGVTNVRFEEGDALALTNFKDDEFDVVHAHQMLQHVTDPVGVLKEMRRVVRGGGGIVACRESASSTWYPDIPGLALFGDISTRARAARGTNPNPGNRIHLWARQAGFERENITCSAGTWCFSSPAEREYWGRTREARLRDPQATKGMLESGFATQEDLNMMADAWAAFVEDEDAWFAMLHGEIICRK